MANAMQSQVAMHEVEEKIEELQIVAEQRYTDVKEELAHIQESVVQLSRQMMEFLRQNMNPQRGQ